MIGELTVEFCPQGRAIECGNLRFSAGIPGCSEMIGSFAVARKFAERAYHFQTEADIANDMEACARELGFDYYAILHHVDLRNAPASLIHIDNYPTKWSEHFIRSRLFLEDPVLHASLKTNIGFTWDCVPKLVQLRSKQSRILEAARREGLGSGFTVPANIPGEAHGSCSFAGAVGRSFPTECLLAAQLVGSFAFQAARRICYLRCPTHYPAAQLTPRQRDCLELVAQGKTDWEIGKILGLCKRTGDRQRQHSERDY